MILYHTITVNWTQWSSLQIIFYHSSQLAVQLPSFIWPAHRPFVFILSNLDKRHLILNEFAFSKFLCYKLGPNTDPNILFFSQTLLVYSTTENYAKI